MKQLTRKVVAAIVAVIRRRRRPLVVVIANLKGGTAKSTSAAFLAHRLAELGLRVKIVDADPQASTLKWQGLAGWPIPVFGLATTTLHRQLWGVIDVDSVDVVIIDTPPLEDQHGIVVSALRTATDVVVPMAPTLMELDRLKPMWRAVEDSAGYRDEDPRMWVLLNRTVPNAASTGTIRRTLEKSRTVFAATVPRREMYAQAFGSAIPEGSWKPEIDTAQDGAKVEVLRFGDDAYGAVVTELALTWSRAEEGAPV